MKTIPVNPQKQAVLVKKADISLDTFPQNSYSSGYERERKMRKIVFGFSLVIAFVASGCNSQLHQSLLLHENRRLEDALYVSHAQVAHLQRENISLREQQGSEIFPSPGRTHSKTWDEDIDLIPPVEMPRVILPSELETTEVPETLKGSQMIPIWTPLR
jgi:hypothetical protein